MNGDGISIPLEVLDRFSAVFDQFERRAAKTVAAVSTTLRQVGAGAAESGRRIESMALSTTGALQRIDGAASGAGTALENLGDAAESSAVRSADAWSEFADSLTGMFGIALDLIDDFRGGMTALVESGVQALLAQVPAIGPALGQLAGPIAGWIVGALAGPTNEELLARQGETMGRIWGDAFSAQAAAALEKVAEQLPRAGSGKYDVVFASYHPDTLRALMDDLTEFGAATQRKLAESMGHGVNYLRDKLHISHAEAFAMMAPAFEQAVDLALQFGETLNPELTALIEHAKNLGVAIEVDAGKFTTALEGFLAQSDISVQALANLRTLAGQVGVDIDAAFSAAMRGFLDGGDLAIDKLEEIARAAASAGYDIEDSLSGALAAAEGKLADLRGELEGFGMETLRWFQQKFRLRDERRDFRQEYIGDAGDRARSAFDDANSGRREEIRALRDAEARQAAEAAYNAEKEAAAAAAEIEAQKKYNELKNKARQLDLDGVNDRREIRALMAGMSEDEKKAFLSLVEQKQERKAHKQALKDQKEEEERVEAAIAAQEALVASIKELVDQISGGFAGMENGIPVDATSHFADELHRAFLDWKYMVDNPLGGPDGSSYTFSGAGGFDYTFSGPAAGYTFPVTLHGTERLVAQPAGGASTAPTVIIQPAVTINALDAKSIRERGPELAEAIAAATRRGLTNLDPRILRV